MDESTKQACLTSIRKRALFLMDCGAGKSTAETRTGLLDAARVLHLLACRWRSEAAHLKAPANPALAEDRMTALMLNFTGHSWYVAYCNAALEIAEEMQDAVKAGELILRSPRTCAKLRADDLDGWMNSDLRAKAKAAQVFPACADWKPQSREWPDDFLYPPGLVEPEEVMGWAAKSGIAPAAELRKLLDMEVQGQPAEPQPAPAAQVELVQPPAPAIKRRDGNLMSPVIRTAQRECSDPYSAAEVWPVMRRMCQQGHKVMLEVGDEGIKWVNSDGDVKFFTMKHLRDTLRNWRNKAI